MCSFPGSNFSSHLLHALDRLRLLLLQSRPLILFLFPLPPPGRTPLNDRQ
jgi:hypothetical protein